MVPAAGAGTSAPAAGEQDREVLVRVPVAVAQAAAVDDHRMVEQGALAIGRRLQLPEEAREELRVERIDLRHAFDPFGVPAMVRERMMRIRDANLRVRAQAAFAPHHHRDDPRRVGLERDDLQIEHQVHVVTVLRRDAGRLVD